MYFFVSSKLYLIFRMEFCNFLKPKLKKQLFKNKKQKHIRTTAATRAVYESWKSFIERPD